MPLVPLSDGWLDLERRAVHRGDETLLLTEREGEVARYLLERSPHPVSRVDLLTDVWHYRPSAATRTVEITIRRMRTKLEADPSNPRHLLTLRGRGYALRPAHADPLPSGEVTLAALSIALPALSEPDEAPVLRALEDILGAEGHLLPSSGGPTRTAVFADAVVAVSWALRVQERLVEHGWPAALDRSDETRLVVDADGTALFRGPRLAVGLEVVAATEHEGPPRYAGAGRERAEALANGARPGEVLATEAVWSRAAPRALELQVAIETRPPIALGRHASAAVQLLPRRLAGRRAHLRAPRHRTNIADPPRPLFGRDDAARELHAALDAAPLVTVVGAPGIGKTTLARAVAAQRLWAHPGGVWFCALTACRGRRDVEAVVRRELDTELPVAEALLQRGAALLVIDNAEHVAPHVADLVATWRAAAPEARLLVTSRRPLDLPDEHRLPLPALPSGDAMALLVERARQRLPGFPRTDGELRATEDLVALLQGVPLALELAAAHLAIMPPADLLARLRASFDLVADGRDHAAHHASLRTAIELSWALLDADEQRLLAQASIFASSFALSDLEAVCPAPEGRSVASILRGLVAHSLAQADEAQRLSLLESVRAAAADALPDAVEEVRPAHARWFAARVEQLARALRVAPERLERLSVDLPNLRTVHAWAVDADPELAARLLLALYGLGPTHGTFAEILELVAPVLEHGALGPATTARLRAVRGTALLAQGDADRGRQDLQDALALARGAEDPAAICEVLMAHAGMQRDFGAWDDAAAALAEAIALARGLDDTMLELRARVAQTFLDIGRSAPKEALESSRAALELARRVGDRQAEAQSLDALGNALTHLGRPDEALPHLAEAARLAVAWPLSHGASLNNLAMTEHRLGRVDAAMRHYGEAIALRRRLGHRHHEAQHRVNLATLLLDRGLLDSALAQFAAALPILEEAENRSFVAICLNNKGAVLQELGAFDQARADLTRALELSPAGGQLHAYSVANLGALDHELGDEAGAREQYEQALGELQALGDRWGETIVLCRLSALTSTEEARALATSHVEALLDPVAAAACRVWLVHAGADDAAALEDPRAELSPEGRLALRLLG